MIVNREGGKLALQIKLDIDDARNLAARLSSQAHQAEHTSGAYWVGQGDEEGNRVEFQIKPTNADKERKVAKRRKENG